MISIMETGWWNRSPSSYKGHGNWLHQNWWDHHESETPTAESPWYSSFWMYTWFNESVLCAWTSFPDVFWSLPFSTLSHHMHQPTRPRTNQYCHHIRNSQPTRPSQTSWFFWWTNSPPKSPPTRACPDCYTVVTVGQNFQNSHRYTTKPT